MSERRRFFPATPVQRVPGRTVELEMQLRPEAPVAAAPLPAPSGGCECAGVVATWLGVPPPGAGDLIVEAIGENATRVRQWGWRWDPQAGESYEADITEYIYFGDWSDVPIEYEGTPGARPAPDLMVAGVVHDIKFDSNILGEWEVPPFRAAIFGQALCEPSWTFEWSAPSPDDPAYSAAGDRAQARGTVLLLSIDPWAESNATVTLTAQARCAGQTVATLTFEVRHIW